MKSTSTSRDSVLARLMEDYLASCEVGQPITAQELAARYPELAEQVADCLASLEFIRRAAAEGGAGPAWESAIGKPESDAVVGLGRLGDFRILREIGRGGMGVVYEAEQISLARRVALKILPFAGVLDPKQLQRFKNEALAAAALDHPHIVDVLGLGNDRGTHFYAMRLIDGCTFADVVAELRAASSVDPREEHASTAAAETRARALLTTLGITDPSCRPGEYYRAIATLVADAADALHHAHEQGVIHRDIKPSNLMLDARGKLWITDFGLAHVESNTTLTISGDLLGTLRYMSPEQATGSRFGVDHRADVYSLGATFYELLTLQPVFGGEHRADLLRQIASDDPRPPRRHEPAIPVDLETISLKALAKTPAGRYATAADLAADLRRWVRSEPIRAQRATLLDGARHLASRHAGLLFVAGAVLFAIGATFLVASRLVQKSNQHAKASLEKEAAAVQHMYSSDMNSFFGSWQDGQFERVAQGLDRYRPRHEALETRDFEWGWLDRLTKSQPKVLVGHTGPVLHVAWSSRGDLAASVGHDGTLRIWDTASGRVVQTRQAHQRRATCVEFSRDGALVVTTGEDGQVRVWGENDWRQKHELADSADGATCAAFTAEGEAVVFGNANGLLSRWRLDDDSFVTVQAHPGSIKGLSAGAAMIATVGDDGAATLWNASDLSMLRTVAVKERASSLALSSDEQFLAVGHSKVVTVFHTQTGERQGSLSLSSPNSLVRCVAFSANGAWLLAGDEDGGVCLWNTDKQVVLANFRRHAGSIHSAAFSPDGDAVVSGGEDQTVRLWDLNAMQGRRRFPAHPDSILALEFSPDGERLATACGDGRLRVYHTDQGTLVKELQLASVLATDATFSPRGDLLAGVAEDGTLRVWNTAGWQERELWAGSGKPGSAGQVAFSRDGANLADTATERVRVWSAVDGKLQHTFQALETDSLPIVAHPDGRTFLLGNRDGSLSRWDFRDGSLLTLPGRHPGSVEGLALSPGGEALLSTSVGRPRTEILVSRLDAPLDHAVLFQSSLDTSAPAWSPRGKTLVVVDREKEVGLWNAQQKRRLFPLDVGPARNPSAAAFSPDARRLAVGGEERLPSGETRSFLFVYEASPFN